MTDGSAPTADAGADAGELDRAGTLRLVAMLAATTILSQFFRAALAAIAPELIRDLALTPRMLGLANGAFFAALFMAQVFVGLFFDRIGVRRTVSTLSLAMVAGSAMHALAGSGETLVLARFVTGIGSAASFMAALVLVSQWFPRAQWSTRLSWVFGLSQIGILAACTPLAVITQWYGWRTAFWITTVLAALTGFAFHRIIRDRREAAGVANAAPRDAGPGALEGLRLIVSLPGIVPVFVMFGIAYAATFTVTGLWAGPYLKDVHGLETTARGHILTVVACLHAIGVLAYGPLDRVFNTRKWVVLCGASATLATLIALAAIPHPPVWLGVLLLFLLALLTNYNPVLLAHMRSHFPDQLAGRGATTGNMCQLAGAALLPILTGFIPGLLPPGPAGGYDPDAYRLIFALLAVTLAAGILAYTASRDTHPRG
jgi:MFS family permease